MFHHHRSAGAQHLAFLALLLGAVAIAFSPIFVRLSELGPFSTAFYRVALALPAFWFWMAFPQSKAELVRTPSTRKDYARLTLAGVFFAGDLAFWHWSINLTSVANSTLLANAAPFFVTLAAFFLFKQRFSKLFLLGLSCAIGGIVLLMGNSLSLGGGHLLGDVLGVITAMFYAAYILAVGKLREEFSTAIVMMWSGLVSGVILLVLMCLTEETLVAGSAVGWMVLFGLALFSHAGGQSLIAYSLAHLPAAMGSVGLLLQPVLAAVLAWILFAEALDTIQVVGGAAVLAGIYVARRGAV
ncbi:MAG: DMT family transporter [Paracoccaceae bacterium]|nr:DMT family transporter [Paracoccaceae bacterium]